MSVVATTKREVWEKYIGLEVGKILCPLCEVEYIYQIDFDFAHVVPISEEGTESIENLRVICGLCISSIGNMNMMRFVRKRFPDSPIYKCLQNMTADDQSRCLVTQEPIMQEVIKNESMVEKCLYMKPRIKSETTTCHKCGIVVAGHKNMYRHLKKYCKGENKVSDVEIATETTTQIPKKVIRLKNVGSNQANEIAQMAISSVPKIGVIETSTIAQMYLDIRKEISDLRAEVAELRKSTEMGSVTINQTVNIF